MVSQRKRPASYRGDPDSPGSLEQVEHLAGYPATALRALLRSFVLPARVPVSAGADLYRITYWSTTNGAPVLVSGLMSAPRGRQPRGTALYMHPTNPDRSKSFSSMSTDGGLAAAAIFAGGGYLLLAPDLVGLGVSRAPQAYIYNPSTIAVTLDFLKAARRACADLGQPWRPELYISGFSQGAHATAVLCRELEQRSDPDWRVKASAAMAGVYDLDGSMFPFLLEGRSSHDTVYLGLLAISYATYYGQPLESVIAPGAAPLLLGLLDGEHDFDAIEAAAPAHPRGVLAPLFLADLDAGRPNWFIAALRENAVRDWAPRTPLRVYVGSADVDAPPADSYAFVARAQQLGGDVQLVDVGAFDHIGTLFHAVPRVRAWFDVLSADSRGPRHRSARP